MITFKCVQYRQQSNYWIANHRSLTIALSRCSAEAKALINGNAFTLATIKITNDAFTVTEEQNDAEEGDAPLIGDVFVNKTNRFIQIRRRNGKSKCSDMFDKDFVLYSNGALWSHGLIAVEDAKIVFT